MPPGWPRTHFACYGGRLMSTLPKLLTQGSALFLDFDGTLADLAHRLSGQADRAFIMGGIISGAGSAAGGLAQGVAAG